METFFLEDTNNVKYDSINLDKLIESLNMDILYYSTRIKLMESTYSNIIINSINNDFRIFREEETTITQTTTTQTTSGSNITKGVSPEKMKSNKGFIDKIIDMFKNLGRKLMEFINNFINKITNIQGMMQSFVSMHKKKILEGANQGIEVSIGKWSGGLADVNQISSIAARYKVINENNKESVETNFTNDINKILDGSAGNVVVKTNSGLASKAISNVGNCQRSIQNIKNKLNNSKVDLKKAEATARRGYNAAKDGEEFEKIKAEIDNYKTRVEISQRINSKLVSVLTKLLKDSHAVNKACLKKSKEMIKDEKNKKKEEKNIKKSEKKIEKSKTKITNIDNKNK